MWAKPYCTGIFYFCFDTNMATSFENSDFILPEEHAEHINELHVRLDLHSRASKFKQNFHLISCLARLTKMTWQDSDKYEIVEQGYKEGHDQSYMYVLTLPKVIGTDTWGSPWAKICIYYSWKPNSDARFHIISAYPCSSSYHHFLHPCPILSNI